MAAKAEASLAVWQGWLKRVEDELIRAHFHQVVWTEFRDAFQDRFPTSDASMLVSYSRLYGEAQMTTIRRIADTNRDAGSLGTLIAALRTHPDVMTRRRYIERSRSPDEAGAEWDRRFAAQPGDDHLDAELLARHAEELRAEVAAIKARVDKTIAHLDKQVSVEMEGREAKLPSVTYGDIREALAFLGELANFYLSLVTESSIGDWTPWITGDWQQPFRSGLFPAQEREQ